MKSNRPLVTPSPNDMNIGIQNDFSLGLNPKHFRNYKNNSTKLKTQFGDIFNHPVQGNGLLNLNQSINKKVNEINSVSGNSVIRNGFNQVLKDQKITDMPIKELYFAPIH